MHVYACACVLMFTSVYLDLLQIIKNPISDHLPTGSRKIGTSFHSDKLVDIKTFASDKPIVFVVGSMAHGKVCLTLSLQCSNLFSIV